MNHRLRTALAAMGIVQKGAKKPDMIFEIDDANGEKLVFPDVNDITEIEEGTSVTAKDGEHVFEADGNTYTIEVVEGKVTKIDVKPIEAPAEEMNAETVEFVEAVAEQLNQNEATLSEMRTEISGFKAANESLEKQLSDLKALMSHADDEDEDEDETKHKKKIMVGNRTIDLSKINLKGKK